MEAGTTEGHGHVLWSSLHAQRQEGLPQEAGKEHKERGFQRESLRNGPTPGSLPPGFPGCALLLPGGNLLASSQMTSAWKMVACGGTRDQLFMQEKARQLLGRLKPSHTSRTLILS